MRRLPARRDVAQSDSGTSGRRVAPELTGILLTLLAMGMFGAMDGISKTLVQHYPAWFVLWLRHLVSLPITILVLAPRHPLAVLTRTRALPLQLLRTVFLVTEMGMVVLAFRTMPLANAHAILAVTPLVVTALSFFVLGEQVGWRRWLAVAIGFLGVLVILRPGVIALDPAALMVCGCMLFYATYMILTRLVARVDAADTSFLLQTVIATFLLTLIGPFFWMPIALAHLPLVLGLGLLGAGGHYCLVRALALAPAVVVQPFTYTLLIWAVVIGFLVFGDLPDLWTFVGAAMVVGAGLYAAWREHRRAHAASSAVRS